MGRELRSKSGIPTSASRRRMAEETAGCDTFKSLAAPAVLPDLFVRRNARSAEISGLVVFAVTFDMVSGTPLMKPVQTLSDTANYKAFPHG